MRAFILLLTAGLTAPPAAAAEALPDPPVAAAETPAARHLTVDDYFRLGEVEDPRLSPDGRWIAYEVTTRDLESDEAESRIWMVPTAGGEAVPMTATGSSASRPRWSPDGKYLAFLAVRDGDKTQVWTLFREGGEAVERTDTAQGVEAYEWSPDGQRMVLVLRDPRPEELAAKEREKEKGKKGREESAEAETPPPWVITRRQFKEDFTGYLDRRRTHLYLLDLASGRTTQLTAGDFDDTEPAFSPDGSLIAFVSNRKADADSNYNTDLWLVAADADAAGGGPRQVTTNPGADRSPAWSPDGTRLAYVSVVDTAAIVYATEHLAVAPAAGGGGELLTAELDRWVESPRFSADGRSVYFVVQDSGEQQLARMPAAGGPVERLIGGTRVVEAFDLGAGDAVAALISEPQRPAEIYLVRGAGLERLSHTNDAALAGIRLGELENVHFPSPDGTGIEGFVVKPPGFDPAVRYPTILWLHGGPMAQYDPRFDIEPQLFAAAGYVVLLPNPRGSTGYGQEFCLAIWQAWGEKDYEDVMAAVDWAIGRGYADPDRLGVGGWSYGGMLTNHVITKTGRFKAAATGASAALYVVNYGHDQYQRWWEYELGLPWQNRELWERLSPFNRVEEIVTPTLIVGGEEDWNVPIINSEQLFLALKRLGRTAELVVYPGEYHTLKTPSYRKHLYQRYLDWFGRYVKGEDAPAEAPAAVSAAGS